MQKDFPFENGTLEKIIKVTKSKFSVYSLYETIAKKTQRRMFGDTIFNRHEILISEDIYKRLQNYYINYGYSLEDADEWLAKIGPKVCDKLTGNEVAISKFYMSNHRWFGDLAKRRK